MEKPVLRLPNDHSLPARPSAAKQALDYKTHRFARLGS